MATIEKKRYLQELCVHGFFRIYCTHDIPDVLKQLVLSFYSIIFDEWNKDLSHQSWRINNDTGDIIATAKNGWCNAFGSLIITKGNIQTWKLRISNESVRLRAVFFGISQIKERTESINTRLSHFCTTGWKAAGYGFYSWTGEKQTNLESGYIRKDYGGTWDHNDIVTMTLDMTGEKDEHYGVLSYKLNEEDLGPAFEKIDINGEFRLAVCVFHLDNIQLICNT